MNFDKIDSKTQFNILLRKKKEVESALQGCSKPSGTIDFTMHKLNREKRKINEEIAKIGFRFMPDTIA